MQRRILTLSMIVPALALLASSAAAQDFGAFEPEFSIGGYLSTQVGVFVSGDEYREERDREAGNKIFPTNHGDKLGDLSMFRNTLFVEMDWRPFEPVSLHAIFRGVRSLGVPADATDAEPPFPSEIGNTKKWVRDTYYSETDLRELYLSIDATDWWSIRVGKQQVSWGELGQYRLLDVVNPTNTTWHFGPLESFEDTRIPLWMLETMIEIRPLQGALEVVWLPLLDNPSDTVTTPLTFTGAWGLPTAPVQENKGIAADKVGSKIFHYPGGDIKDSRIGARWKGEIGNVTYSLAYMYTHQLSPPIPTHHVMYWESNEQGVEVHLDFPRQHIAGFSLEVPFESPVGIVARLEAAYEPNRVYPQYSGATGPAEPYQVTSAVSSAREAVDTITPLHSMSKHVVTAGLQLMRPTMIRFLNPTQNFIIVLQYMYTGVVDFDADDKLITVPGFDTSKLKQHNHTIVGVITTNYLNGMIKPVLVGAYLPPGDGFLSAQCHFVFGNHWRIKLAGNFFWGADPYNKVGFFRDRDEINLKIAYQF